VGPLLRRQGSTASLTVPATLTLLLVAFLPVSLTMLLLVTFLPVSLTLLLLVTLPVPFTSLLITRTLIPLPLLLLIPLLSLTLLVTLTLLPLARLLSLACFWLSFILAPLSLALGVPLALTLGLSALTLAGGLFVLTSLRRAIFALSTLLSLALFLTLLRAAVLHLATAFLPAPSAAWRCTRTG
jgi:hypothetical protein